MNPYSSLCDDFGVYVYVNTKMDLPPAARPSCTSSTACRRPTRR